MLETGMRGLPHVLTVEVQVSSKRRKVKESWAQEAEETKRVWYSIQYWVKGSVHCSLAFFVQSALPGPGKGDWHWSALLGSPIQTVN